jgi:SagB-type dehydrogenase family enzyme
MEPTLNLNEVFCALEKTFNGGIVMKKTGMVLWACLGILVLSWGQTPALSEDTGLEPPNPKIGVDLMEAFRVRKSTKVFDSREVDRGQLSTILWSANGINRESGRRTAPSAYGKYYMELYIASEKGIHHYKVPEHKLEAVSGENVKNLIARQGYVAQASHIFVMTADLTKFDSRVEQNERIPVAFATAGCIGQNIYLAANALNLGTSFVLNINKELIQEKLKLKPEEIPICVMPLGYPKR